MNSLFLPYTIWRGFCIKSAVFMWRQFAVNPQHLMLLTIIVGTLYVLLEGNILGVDGMTLLVMMALVVLRELEDTFRSHVGTVIFELDVCSNIWKLLVNMVIVWALSSIVVNNDYLSIISQLCLGYSNVYINGDGGKFWQRFKVKSLNLQTSPS